MSKKRRPGSTRSISRRSFIGVSAAFLSSLAGTAAGNKGSHQPPNHRRRLVMVIDLDRCIGCRACAVSCKAEHGIGLGKFRSWVSQKETGRYPAVVRRHLPRLCNHCENPACAKVCPTGATRKRDDGIVAIDHKLCIGCRHCMGACPYNVRYFNPTPVPDEDQFPARTHGTVDKCDFCLHRVDRGVVPACVNTCPAGARFFGDLNDPDSEVARLLTGANAVTLLPRFGTGPSVYYIGGDPGVFEEA